MIYHHLYACHIEYPAATLRVKYRDRVRAGVARRSNAPHQNEHENANFKLEFTCATRRVFTRLWWKGNSHASAPDQYLQPSVVTGPLSHSYFRCSPSPCPSCLFLRNVAIICRTDRCCDRCRWRARKSVGFMATLPPPEMEIEYSHILTRTDSLGYRYSLLFASRGANVVVNDFNAQAAQKVVDEIKAGAHVKLDLLYVRRANAARVYRNSRW